jgi:hypothetical protein
MLCVMERISIPLATDTLGLEKLSALQAEFSSACGLVAGIAFENNCYSRVALHHLAYKPVRDALPGLGAQLASNAIYAVCKAARVLNTKAGPIAFNQKAPVFFDHHTLSVRNGVLSLFTLEGRLKIQLPVSKELDHALRHLSLKEALLEQRDAQYFLTFFFKHAEQQAAA